MPAIGDDPRVIERSVRPVVARSSTGMPAWLLVGLVAALGTLLFILLQSQREDRRSPVVSQRYGGVGEPASAPILFVPPLAAPSPAAPPSPSVVPTPAIVHFPAPPRPAPTPQIVYVSQPSPPAPAQRLVEPPRQEPVSALVFDNTAGDNAGPSSTYASNGNTSGSGGGTPIAGGVGTANAGRASATIIAHRSTLVPEGTMIPAVLETALDSTRAGPARAVVTNDVRGFDGSKVLVPRGSRLIGEYRADLQPGQNRALVIWTRLIRPDGASIALASPAADPLGRIGIKGKVNAHFLERFASALLSTTLNVSAGLASRIGSGNSVAVLALPGTLGGTVTPVIGDQVQRTLRVPQGVSIRVFVTRDLDFTGVGAAR